MPRMRVAPVDNTVCTSCMIGVKTGSLRSIVEGCSAASVDSGPTSCVKRAVIVVRSASSGSASIS